MWKIYRELTKQPALPMAIIVIITNARAGLITLDRLFYKIVAVISSSI